MCRCRLKIPIGPLRIPGWVFCGLASRGLLGRVGRRWGFLSAEFLNRGRARRALRSFWGASLDDGYFLRRQPCRNRVDPSFMLATVKARHGGLAAVGYCGCLFRCNDSLSSRTGGFFCSREGYWKFL